MKSPDLICSCYQVTVLLTLICSIAYEINSLSLKIYHIPIHPNLWILLSHCLGHQCALLQTLSVYYLCDLLHAVYSACIHPTCPLLTVISHPLRPCSSKNGLGTDNMGIIWELDRSHPDLLTQNLSDKILRWFKVWEVLLRLTLDFIKSYLSLETFPDSYH